MTKIAYLRVSTDEQTVENQKMQLEKFGIEKWFIDEAKSGSLRDRKALNEMLDYLRDTDTVYVTSLDRLSRNMKDLEEIQAIIKIKKATLLPSDILEKLGMSEIPSDSISKLVFDIVSTVSSFYAENERVKMLERQKVGIERAKKDGKFKGGTVQYSKNSSGKNLLVYQKVFEMLADKQAIKKIADNLSISRNTVYSLRNRVNQEILNLNSLNIDIAQELKISQKYVDLINTQKQ